MTPRFYLGGIKSPDHEMTGTNNNLNNVTSPSGSRQQIYSRLATPVSIRSISEILINSDSHTIPCTNLINSKMNTLSYDHTVHDNCTTSITPCNQQKCLTCPILNTSHFYRSTVVQSLTVFTI